MLLLDIMLPLIFFLLGVTFASFGNMLMYRFANDKPILKDSRSYCPKCGHQIAWYDNIPLLSYLILRGKCRHCHEKIAIRYFLVELFGGLFFLVMYFLYLCLYPTGTFTMSVHLFDYVNSLTIAFTVLFLLISAYVDHFKKEVPLSMMLVMFLFALTNFIFHWVLNGFSLSRILGFGVPLVLLLLIYLISVLALKVEPMGLADIIIFAILGLLLGGINLLSVVLFSSLICSIIELIRIKKTNERREIPFVPYIFIGTLITVFFTTLLISLIEKMIGGLL